MCTWKFKGRYANTRKMELERPVVFLEFLF